MIRLFETHDVRSYEELDRNWTLAVQDKKYTVSVPHCWESIPELNTYRGKAVYTKTISVPYNTNLRFIFKGVSHTADVYFDDEFICHHYNAYTEFSAVIPMVSEGKHEIKILVDNSFSEESALHRPNDYYSYGGLSRPVIMECVPDAFIKNLQLIPDFKDDKWFLNIKTHIESIAAVCQTMSLTVSVNEQMLDFGSFDVAPGTNVAEQTFEMDNVTPWSAESPVLYTAQAILSDDDDMVTDDLIERFGFRTVEIKDGKILINGKSIYIKGFNRHEDHPQFGCSLPVSAMEYDLDLFSDLGANAVRTCHYPNDERFLDLCDERGLYVWEENHARGIGVEDMVNPNFQPQCLDCINEMIPAHINHPSIFIWGILNECGSESDFGRECYKEQYELIRSLDPSRPVTSATCRLMNDICLDLPDVVSINLYPQWYSDTDPGVRLSDIKDWIDSANGEGKPLILSEFGAGAIYGYHTPIRVKWSEERQCDILEEQISKMATKPYVNGIFLWQFADCRVTEEVWFRSRPKTENNKGIVDIYRRPKLAYDVVKKWLKQL